MNNQRRKAINDLLERLQGLSVEDMVSEAESIRDEEQEYFDNMPEGLQQSERGQNAEAAASALDEAVDSINEINEQLQEAISKLEEALG